MGVRGGASALSSPEYANERKFWLRRGNRAADPEESAPAVPGAEGQGRRVFRRCQERCPVEPGRIPGLWSTTTSHLSRNAPCPEC